MKRYICIHGHFYQPPRENPWLELIEIQDSAYPYNDWNERISAECYAPNTESRIQDAEGRIIDIVNNYAKISFNFGPTLLSWMEKNTPVVYEAILEADKKSLKVYNGHGAALAQVYNHMIMPLANIHDKRTQIHWGIKDFEHRFGRKPEGMWLAESAVDLETLELLVAHDITFTILSPYQARAVRKFGTKEWTDVGSGSIDPKRTYACVLPSGKKITLFFYDGPLSQEVAFGNLTKDGSAFAHRLLSAFPGHCDYSPLVHIATDGETYGHHHKFGDMALAFMLHFIEQKNLAEITIYSAFLEKYPPEYEVQIIENSSWSCAHGIERWRNDCGCHVAGEANWNQSWRKPLREAMDWLRDELAFIFENESAAFTAQPWALRDAYIQVINDRCKKNTEAFIKRNTKKSLSHEHQVKLLKLLEMQRHAMFMYTSCGWFFDDVSGIETVQIMQYAARAIQLAREIGEIDLEKEYINRLRFAKSNLPKKKDGEKIYLQAVKPAMIELQDIGAYFAIALLFEDLPNPFTSYAHTVYRDRVEQGKVDFQKLIVGQLRIVSHATLEEKQLDFTLLHQGGHNLTIGVREQSDGKSMSRTQKEIMQVFKKHDFDSTLKLIKEHFGESHYSLWDLLKNERRKALNNIFDETLQTIEDDARKIYDLFFPLMKIKKNIRVQLPKSLVMIMEFILNRDLCFVLESDDIDKKHLDEIIREIKRFNFMRDKETICMTGLQTLNKRMYQCLEDPFNTKYLETVVTILEACKELQLSLELWKAQNIYFKVGQKALEEMKSQAKQSNKKATKWIDTFNKIGQLLELKTTMK